MSENRILVGTQSFRKFREQGKRYVDKTAFISEFLSGKIADVSLITRPRRFGKSLLLNMLMEFFDKTKDSRELFDGLAVSQDKELCAKWMNKYPVIYLSFNEIKNESFDVIYNQLFITISSLYKKYIYLLDSNKINSFDKEDMISIIKRSCDSALLGFSIKMLCEAIYQDCGIKPIILIDEYDAPLAKIEASEDYKKMSSFLDSFFEISLKDNNFFEFAILTGCLRYTPDGITTGFNNYVSFDIDDLRFADKFGFTQAEVQSLLEETGFSDKMDTLQEWYGGYCLGNSYPIYCPSDVMQYVSDLKEFSETEPQAYWLNFGSHDLVRKFIDKINVLDTGKAISTLVQGGTVTVKCNGSMKFRNLYNAEDFWTALCLKGYLTKVPEAKKSKPFQPVEVRIPNREVYYIFKEAMASWFKKNFL